MKITEVQIKQVNHDPIKCIKAKVSVVIDNELILHNIRVIEKVTDGVKKKFVAFPSQRIATLNENNEPVYSYFNIYHSINSENRVKFEEAIYKALDKYEQEHKEH